MMISGAFLLSNNKNEDYKSFYKKTVVGTLVPTIVFTVLYILYEEGTRLFDVVFKGEGISHLINFNYLIKVFCGEPVRMMWYMYTLLVVSLFVPLIIRFKNSIGEDKFLKVSIGYILIAMISGWLTDLHLLNWSIGKAACYIGYLLAGYQIKRNITKNNTKGCVFIILGFVVMSIMAYLRYYHMNFEIYNDVYGQEDPLALINLFGPFVCTSSLLIFTGFAKLDLKENKLISKFAVDTFPIYLSHGFALYFEFYIFIGLNLYMKDSILFIPIGFVFVLIVSIMLSKIYKKAWTLLNKNNRIDNFFLNALKLN